MAEKERIDVRLVREGLAPSRERAKEWIKDGRVKADGKQIQKAGAMVEPEAKLSVSGAPMPYVSRGGLKLQKALDTFSISVDGRVCLDAGASTGGFTDCMLQRGAAKVYAVDVGYGQLAEKLRSDSRVINIENTNVRELSCGLLGEACDFASADLSFISLTKVLPAIVSCLKEEAELVCLIKPQFEAGRDKVGKKGVVKNPRVHRQVLMQVAGFCREMGLTVQNLTVSPIRGQEGNQEFLIHLLKAGENRDGKGEGAELQTLIERAMQEAQRCKHEDKKAEADL